MVEELEDIISKQYAAVCTFLYDRYLDGHKPEANSDCSTCMALYELEQAFLKTVKR